MAKIIYENQDGLSVEICYSAPFLLKDKEGFETVDNEITSTVLHGADGERLVSKRLASRNLLIDGMIVSQSEIERYKLRRELIQATNPKLAAKLIFYINEETQYEIDVIPTKAPSFKSVTISESVNNRYDDFSLALTALDPYWRDVSYYNSLIPMTKKTNAFKFPLQIVEGFIFGSMKNGEIVEINNDGDETTGAEFEIKVYGDCTNPRIYNILTEEYFGFKGYYKTGDILTFSTKRGEKYVRITRNGKTTNEMMHRMEGSSFIQIEKGINYLQSQADKGNDYLYVSLKFTPLVMGV